VDLLVTGYSNKEIARTLNLSYGTVKNYMFDLMRLLNARSRLELVAKIREGAPTTQSNMPLMVHSPLRHKNGSS
jgi:DNA-binding NarL/FixJ family response regulator